MRGLIGLIIATKSSKQWKITMQDRYLCCLPTFSLARQWPPTFFILESQLVLNCFAAPLPYRCSGVAKYTCCVNKLSQMLVANLNMTSYCNVTNSVYPVKMTTIRHCSILEFSRGASNQAVAPGITRPLHATGPSDCKDVGREFHNLEAFRENQL